MSEISSAIENIHELLQATRRKVEVLEKMLRLLSIAELLRVPVDQFRGLRVSTRVQEVDRRTLQRWRGYVLVVSRYDDGLRTDSEFPLREVPLCLWPEWLRVEYEAFERSEAKRREWREQRVAKEQGLL